MKIKRGLYNYLSKLYTYNCFQPLHKYIKTVKEKKQQ